jgi:hypothetical protein
MQCDSTPVDHQDKGSIVLLVNKNALQLNVFKFHLSNHKWDSKDGWQFAPMYMILILSNRIRDTRHGWLLEDMPLIPLNIAKEEHPNVTKCPS